MKCDPPPGVPHAICRNHKGLILATGDHEGKQFWCPVGRELWTYSKTWDQQGFRGPLRYPKVTV